MNKTATAIAHPNIAFIKYWGNRDDAERLPANGSLSMNLGALHTVTTVTFRDELCDDVLTIDGKEIHGAALSRVSSFLDHVRALAPDVHYAEIVSQTNFPMGAGIASSAAAFAALALAASNAAGLNLNENECSRLARLGSGSACRSVPDGFCEWSSDTSAGDSCALSIAPASHWDLVDLIAVVSEEHKKVGSSAGHTAAFSSPFQAERVRTAPDRVKKCRNAILNRDFAALAEVSELDMTMMHAVMMTQDPPLFYWEPASLRIMKSVREWRDGKGLDCFATLDAGPNVHVICTAKAAYEVLFLLKKIPGVQDVLTSAPGGKAQLL